MMRKDLELGKKDIGKELLWVFLVQIEYMLNSKILNNFNNLKLHNVNKHKILDSWKY